MDRYRRRLDLRDVFLSCAGGRGHLRTRPVAHPAAHLVHHGRQWPLGQLLRACRAGEGHKAGIVSLREIITACVRLEVEVLSAYAFSTENWSRPQAEVNLLMHLFAQTFIQELPLLKRENVRVVFLGDISALPAETREVFERGLAETAAHTGMVLALAVNYGARAELARAACRLAERAVCRRARSCAD